METFSIQLLILLVFQYISSLTAYTLTNTTSCFVKDIMTLTCKPGEMIYIHQIYYGYSPTNQCTYSPEDCLIPDQHRYPCMGQQQCRISLPPNGSRLRLDGCKQHSNYMLVRHACIPAKSVVDICSGATLTSETGFIKSPNYPFNYPANTKCTSYIRVHRTQQLKLYVFDFKLQSVNWTSGRCSDDLYIQTGTQSDTHCGDHKPLRHQPLTRTLRNEITLTFESNDSVQKKGFWLYYEAYPHLPPTTTESSTLTPDTASAGDTDLVIKGAPTQPTEDSSHPDQAGSISQPNQQRLPLAEAIIGAVIGTLFIVVLTLLIILVIQRRRSQNTKPAKTMMPSSPSANTDCTNVSVDIFKGDLYEKDSKVVDIYEEKKVYPDTSKTKSPLYEKAPFPGTNKSKTELYEKEPFPGAIKMRNKSQLYEKKPFPNTSKTHKNDLYEKEVFPTVGKCTVDTNQENDVYPSTSHSKLDNYNGIEVYPSTCHQNYENGVYPSTSRNNERENYDYPNTSNYNRENYENELQASTSQYRRGKYENDVYPSHCSSVAYPDVKIV